MAGVEVTPMVGPRSPQLIADAGHAGPSDRCQRWTPVTGSNPYTSLVCVAVTTVFLDSSGWAYTCPVTGALNS